MLVKSTVEDPAKRFENPNDAQSGAEALIQKMDADLAKEIKAKAVKAKKKPE